MFPLPYLSLMTVLLVWTLGLPWHNGAQPIVYKLISSTNILSAVLNLERVKTCVNFSGASVQ